MHDRPQPSVISLTRSNRREEGKRGGKGVLWDFLLP